MQIRAARLDERLLMPAPCGRETGVIRQLCALGFATCGESLDRNIIQSDPQAMRAPPAVCTLAPRGIYSANPTASSYADGCDFQL